MKDGYKPLRTILILSVGAVGALSCGDDSTGPTAPEAASITISPENPTLDGVGSTVEFSATVLDSLGAEIPGAAVTWTSSAPGVVSIDQSGTATALQGGVAVIEATSGDAASSTDAAVVVPLDFSAIAAGSHHACGLTTDGIAYCWGMGDEGVLGYGGTDHQYSPVRVAGDLAFQSLSAGPLHTCGVTADGLGYCWGFGDSGRLGDGSTEDTHLTPVQVSGGVSFLSISAGVNHSCGVATSGAAYCWGRATHYKLGNESLVSTMTPSPVSGGHAFQSISAGDDHTCGLTADGRALCWGVNKAGNLGTGSVDLYHQEVPVEVLGGYVFSSVSAGFAQTCGVSSAGQAFCWGRGEPILGDGESTHRTEPFPVVGGHEFASVEISGRHACGVTLGGAAFCWGMGGDGQLGTGALVDMSSPVLVAGTLTFSSVAVGDGFSCGVTTSGDGYCWGEGNFGKLGAGSLEDHHTPVSVSGSSQ
jgi:alpha-tubulin suppressor-like RCC1 family protein